MTIIHAFKEYLLFIVFILTISTNTSASDNNLTTQQDSQYLESWNHTETRARIIDLVKRITDKKSPDYITPAERFAVFDLDGTLLTEMPDWLSVPFAMDLIREKAHQHPQWNDDPLLASVIANNPPQPVEHLQWRAMAELLEKHWQRAELREKARNWLATARNKEGRLYNQTIYQPMVELIAYLQANHIQTWISTGTMDAFSQEAGRYFNIPANQVIGTKRALKYMEKDGKAMVVYQENLQFDNSYGDKVVALEQLLGGVRPVIVAGNTTNDMAMMTWSEGRNGPSLQILIVHDDAVRERIHHAGEVLDRATERNWLRVSMRDDWKIIFPPAR